MRRPPPPHAHSVGGQNRLRLYLQSHESSNDTGPSDGDVTALRECRAVTETGTRWASDTRAWTRAMENSPSSQLLPAVSQADHRCVCPGRSLGLMCRTHGVHAAFSNPPMSSSPTSGSSSRASRVATGNLPHLAKAAARPPISSSARWCRSNSFLCHTCCCSPAIEDIRRTSMKRQLEWSESRLGSGRRHRRLRGHDD